MAAARIWNNGEGGTSGTTVTTANSGANSGNAWQTVTIGTGSTLTYDNTHAAHGKLAYKVVNGAAAKSIVEWTTTFGTQTTFWGRFYLYATANPANPLALFQAATAGTQRCAVGLNANGTLAIYGTGAAITNTTTAITLNAWVRVEFTFTINTTTGSGTVNLYNTPNSFTADETISVSSQNFGSTSAAQWNFGIANTPAGSNTVWLDSIALSTDGYPGPDFMEQAQTSSGSLVSSKAVTWVNNTTTGNTIVVVVAVSGAGGGTVSSITDSQLNSYSKIDGSAVNADCEIWYASNITGGTTPAVTVTMTQSTSFEIFMREYSGVSTTPLDVHSNGNGTSATPTTTGVTTGQAQEIIVAGINTIIGSNATSTGPSFNNFQKSTVISGVQGGIEDRVVSSTGTYTGDFVNSVSAVYDTVIATFKISGGAVSATVAQVAATVTATGGTQTVATPLPASITQVAASVTATGGTQSIATINDVAISQVAGSVTASGGTQAIATSNFVSIAQVAGSVTASGGTQLAQTNTLISQVAGVVTASGGTQVIATSNFVSLAQVAGMVTAAGGTQTIATVNNVSISQLAGSVTASGGTQTIATVNNVAIAQLAGNVTATGGSQGVNSIQDATVAQLAGTVTASGGSGTTVFTLQTVSITQVAANVTATGGTQLVQTNALITQAGATVTASGGTQVVATVNIVAISQLAGSVTVSGGTQAVAAIMDVSIAQLAASVTATGGTQSIDTVNDVAITQTAGLVTASGGTQSLTALVDVVIAQQAANILASGGVQTVRQGSVIVKSGSPKTVFLLDGTLATRISNNFYSPL